MTAVIGIAIGLVAGVDRVGRGNVIRDADEVEAELSSRTVCELGLCTDAHDVQRCAGHDIDGRCRFRVLVVDGCVVGFSAVRCQVDGRGMSTADLVAVAVHERWRHRGLGRALVSDAGELASSSGAAHLGVMCPPYTEQFFFRVGAHRVATAPPRHGRPWWSPVLHLAVNRSLA